MKHFVLFLAVAASLAAGDSKQISVWASDVVIPQFVDGDHWRTTVTLINLDDTQEARYAVWFYRDDGLPMYVEIAGSSPVIVVQGTIPVNGSVTFGTTGTAPTLNQGWALLQTNNYIGGFAVLSTEAPGYPLSEAVVPISSKLEHRMRLAFDQTNGFICGYAIANPASSLAPTITVTIRDEQGNPMQDPDQITLGLLQHIAFNLAVRYPGTIGKRGTIELSTPSQQLSALGLRFNPRGAFTSFHALSNPNW